MPETNRPLKVFLCHAHSDKDAVKALYDRLVKDGVDAWLDKEKLLPGQDWELEIRKAVRGADVVVVCLSKDFNKAGFRQKEVRLALDTAMEQPEGEIFIIPARLEECDTLESLRKWHWVDLFDDDGYDMLMRALRARADRIGVTLQVKRSWMPRITSPRVKAEKPAETKEPITPTSDKHPVQEDEIDSKIEEPKSPGKAVRKPFKHRTKYIVAIIGIAAIIIAVVVSSPLIEMQFSQFPAEITDVKGIEMVLISEGEFMMGSDDGSSDEQPIHQVYLDTYYIDKYEVTNTLYKACVDARVCAPPVNTSYYNNSKYAKHPVVYVNWNMAKEYCEWRGARLPTEAEWEKAARGTDGRTYSWGDEIDNTYANYDQNVGDTTPVGSYPAGVSPYGAYDMGGNVWEWVADWYDETYYASSPETNPIGPESGDYRVLRGGSWYNDNKLVRSAIRVNFYPSYTDDIIGFRCSRSVASP